jgi:hypothetical protein
MSIFFVAPIEQHPDYDKVTTVPASAHANAAFPASNLLTYDPTQVMLATQVAPVITWDLGAAKNWDVISLIHTNLAHDATILIEGSPDNSAWTTLVAGGTLALAHCIAGQTVQNKKHMLRRNLTLFNSPTVLTYRYIRITPTNTGGVLPFFGRLFVGLTWKPTYGWQFGSNLTFLDLSRRERTDRGTLVMDYIAPVPGASVKMDFLSKQEMMDFVWEFNYWRGGGKEFLAVLDAEDQKYLQKMSFYCTITEGQTISFDTYNTHSIAWILENLAAA